MSALTDASQEVYPRQLLHTLMWRFENKL